jgi:hypothetical protein
VWTPRAEFFGRGKVVNIVGQLAFRLEYSMIVTGEFLVAKSQVDALIGEMKVGARGAAGESVVIFPGSKNGNGGDDRPDDTDCDQGS